MKHHYADIRDRIDEEPKWWDEYAVPRYCDFSPEVTANIYAKEAALVLIECQNCGAEFRVCFSCDGLRWRLGKGEVWKLSDEIADVHYGDPPNAGCCGSGPTMNSIPRRVLEFWRAGHPLEWERVAELELALECDWADA